MSMGNAWSRGLAVGLLTLAGSACYHATVETGATPSTQVVSRSFAASWIGGLVPPSLTETTAKCPNGVAKVETQLSFVNMLVGVITLGIYTPMSVKATCAAPAAAAAEKEVPRVEVSAAESSEAAVAITEAARAAAQGVGHFYLTVQP